MQVLLIPFSSSAVISAVPGCIAVTIPALFTVATFSFEDFHVNFLFVAFSGRILHVRLSFCVGYKVSSVLFNVTVVTGISASVTLILQYAFNPLLVVIVIVAVPLEFAVNFPFSSTDTTAVLLD